MSDFSTRSPRLVTMTLREGTAVAVATAAAWLVLIVLMNPRGEFPLMDDWIYHRMVAAWIAGGRLEIPEVTQMVAVGHVALGVALARLAGLTFETLRVAMLATGWLGVVALYAACRAFGAAPAVAGLAAATLLVNPIYLILSATFMTDVPFFLLSTLALIFYARALDTPSWRSVAAATALSAAAGTIRQPALILPTAFLVGLPLRHGRRVAVLAAAPFAIVTAELAVLPIALEAAGRLPRDYNLPLREMMRHLGAPSVEWLSFSAKRALNIGFHLGWFLLPFTLLARGSGENSQGSRDKGQGTIRLAAALAGLIALAVLVTGKVAPWGSSLLYDFGLGGVSLYDVAVLGLPHLPRAPWLFWFIFTIASGITVAILVVQWGVTLGDAFARPGARARAASAFALLAVAGYAGPMVLSWFYDRYLLPIVPCLVLYAAIRPGFTARRVAVSAAILVPLGLAAAAAGHDYFAWNRARWQALGVLMARASPRQIDGGYEFAGLTRYVDGTDWQQPADRTFVVAFGPVPGYREVGRFEYAGWLPPRRAAILALERDGVSRRSEAKADRVSASTRTDGAPTPADR